MYKNKNIPIIILSALLSCSFQKVTVDGLIQSMSIIGPDGKVTEFYSYTYDDKGRLYTSTHTSTNVAGNYGPITTNYYYYPDSVVSSTPDYDGRQMREVWILNNKGMAVKQSGGRMNTYDENGYLIREDFTDQPGQPSIRYSIVNGDVTAKMNYSGNTLSYVVNYTYYPTLDKTEMGMNFTGHKSVHLIKGYSAPNSKTISSIYKYKFDTKGRVLMMWITDQTSQNTNGYNTKYTYF